MRQFTFRMTCDPIRFLFGQIVMFHFVRHWNIQLLECFYDWKSLFWCAFLHMLNRVPTFFADFINCFDINLLPIHPWRQLFFFIFSSLTTTRYLGNLLSANQVDTCIKQLICTLPACSDAQFSKIHSCRIIQLSISPNDVMNELQTFQRVDLCLFHRCGIYIHTCILW